MDKIFYEKKCTDVETICSNFSLSGLNSSHCLSTDNKTAVALTSFISRVVSTEEFFNQNVLGVGNATWENFGLPQWHLVLCLTIAWIFSFFCVIKGVQSMGKLVYFTAVFPYVVLFILLIRALTLDGSWDGVMHYITPQWESLLNPSMYGDASSQIFYSFGIGCGSLVTLASYNKVSLIYSTFKFLFMFLSFTFSSSRITVILTQFSCQLSTSSLQCFLVLWCLQFLDFSLKV